MERKEAIEVVKKNYPHCAESGTQFETALRTLIPELKESGDEQSKNWILEYLYDGLRKSDEQFKGQFKAAIAWLEKQGQVKESINSQHENKMCKGNGDSLTSEDERIRKALLNEFTHLQSNGYKFAGLEGKEIIAWLERQKPSDVALEYLKENHSPSEVSDFQAAMNIAVAKAYDRGRADAEMQKQDPCRTCDHPTMSCINFPCEKKKQAKQKPTEWSERDKEEFQIAIDTLVEAGQHDSAHWLKSLQDRVQPQPIWREEDEKNFKWLCRIIHSCTVRKGISLAEESELGNWIDKWLNHAPQNTWKPSEEQMETLFIYAEQNNKDGYILNALYQQLKKLKEK